jgi:hypothetical protein
MALQFYPYFSRITHASPAASLGVDFEGIEKAMALSYRFAAVFFIDLMELTARSLKLAPDLQDFQGEISRFKTWLSDDQQLFERSLED